MVCSTFRKCSPSKILDCHVTVPKSIFARASLVIPEWFLSQKWQTDSVMSNCEYARVAAWNPGLRLGGQAVSGSSWREFCDWSSMSSLAFTQQEWWHHPFQVSEMEYLWLHICICGLGKGSGRNKAVLFILTQAVLCFKVAAVSLARWLGRCSEGHGTGHLSGSRWTCVSLKLRWP